MARCGRCHVTRRCPPRLGQRASRSCCYTTSLGRRGGGPALRALPPPWTAGAHPDCIYLSRCLAKRNGGTSKFMPCTGIAFGSGATLSACCSLQRCGSTPREIQGLLPMPRRCPRWSRQGLSGPSRLRFRTGPRPVGQAGLLRRLQTRVATTPIVALMRSVTHRLRLRRLRAIQLQWRYGRNCRPPQ